MTVPPEALRVAMVTGASRGIGEATAHRLSQDGHRVVLVARDRDALARVADALPGPSLVVPADVTDQTQVAEAFAVPEPEWRPVDILLVDAGTATASALV